MSKMINVKDFSKYPGPWYSHLGSFSGEEFRDEFLIPAINEYEFIGVNLDGVFGYGSSFLEEAFGGLVRKGVKKESIDFIRNNLVSKDDPSIIIEIQSYIDDEFAKNM